MATYFVDYQQQVMQAYERKKGNNTLPHGLMHLTPANIKEECVKKCTTDVNRRDEKAIRDFCGDLNESKNCHTLLQRCDTDKFRPLVNYLKGKSESTDPKNIELLAWLIDFPGRPWVMGKEIPVEDLPAENPVIPEIPAIPENPENPENPARVDREVPGVKFSDDAMAPKSTDPPTPAINAPRKIPGKSAKTLATAVMLSLVAGTGGMWWWMDKNQPPGSGNCMYWQEDHYVPVACNKKIPNTMIIPLDSMKLKYFRKIASPDTITYEAIGKVWYSKIKGKMEYYTLPGEHPVVFGYQLRPITSHIIDVHIHPQKATSGETSN